MDIDEVVRLNDVADKKKRGKGAPKKARTEGTRRFLDSSFGAVLTVIAFL